MAGEGTTQVGKAHLYGFPATIVFYNPAGTSLGTAYTQPNTKSLKLGHSVDNTMTKSVQGQITAVTMSGEYVTCQFDFLPEGDTVADALESALVPEKGSTAVVSGAPVIKYGPFTDVLNTAGASDGGQRWIYLGGGGVDLSVTEAGSSSITLHRFPGIVGTAAAIVS